MCQDNIYIIGLSTFPVVVRAGSTTSYIRKHKVGPYHRYKWVEITPINGKNKWVSLCYFTLLVGVVSPHLYTPEI